MTYTVNTPRGSCEREYPETFLRQNVLKITHTYRDYQEKAAHIFDNFH